MIPMSDTETVFKLLVSPRNWHRRPIEHTVNFRIAFNPRVIIFANQNKKFVRYKISYPKLIFVYVKL